MRKFTMRDIISLLNLPAPPENRQDYNIPCPCCDRGKDKHLNINLRMNVFRCPRCDFSGGIFDLYSHYSGIDRKKVRAELVRILEDDSAPTRRPKGKPRISVPEPVVKGYTPTDIESRDKTYRALFAQLTLAPDHRDNLLGRGLDGAAIEHFAYKTTPMVGHAMLAKTLLSSGCYLAGVPGFHRDENGDWTLVKSKRGIMVPVLDMQGRVQGVKIRRDNVKKRKFRWLSSINMPDGCGAGGWVHMVGPPREEILLGEGPMKADIIHHLTGQTMLALPGANALTQWSLYCWRSRSRACAKS